MIGLLKYLNCFSLFKFIFYRTMGKGKYFFKLKKKLKLENLRDETNACSLHFLMQMRGLQTINTRKFGFIKRLDKGQITMKELESWRFEHQSQQSKRQLSKSFMVVIRLLSTCFTKPNFHVSLSHQCNTTVSLEVRNLYLNIKWQVYCNKSWL